MKVFKVLFAALTIFASSALYAQHDYSAEGGSPDSDTNFIRTGTPCELGSALTSYRELDDNHRLVRAGENGKLYNFFGKTNFDCKDGRGVRWTKQDKKLKWGSVIVAEVDMNTCTLSYNEMRLFLCYKTFAGNPDQVFIPDPSKPFPPLQLATDLDPRPLPVCNRQAPPSAPVAQYVAPVAQTVEAPREVPFTVQTDLPDNIGKVSAVLHGSFIAGESQVPYNCGFAWGKVPKRGRVTLRDLDNFTPLQAVWSYGHGGFFSYPLDNLDRNGTYGFSAACKQDGLGEPKYGDIVEFSLRHTGWFERHPVLGPVVIGAVTYGIIEGVRSINRPHTPSQPKIPRTPPCTGRCAPEDQHPRGPAWPGNPPSTPTQSCPTCGQQPGPVWTGVTPPSNSCPTCAGPGGTWPPPTSTPTPTNPTGPGNPWTGH